MALWSKLFGGRKGEKANPATEDRRDASTGADADQIDGARLSFLEAVAEKLRETSDDLDFIRDVSAFALKVRARDGCQHTLFLENLFSETRDLSPEAREERVAKVLGLLAASAEAPRQSPGWDEARRSLVPCLRAATHTSVMGAGERTLVRRPFLPMLLEIVARDTPDTIRYVTASEVEGWDVTHDDLFDAARATLASVETRLEAYDPEAPYPLWFVANDDNYESSRPLTPGWLASLSARVNGRPVAIVPHSRLLIVGGDGDDDCVRRLVEIAEREYGNSPRRISPALYTVDDAGEVVPLRMPAGHPLASAVERGHRALEQNEYGAQSEAIKSSAKGRQDVAFVAKYSLLKRDADGTFLSYATWGKNVITLLPQVDRIAFVLKLMSTDFLMVPWSAVVSLDPQCLALEPEMHPPRYRTVRWPTESELERLRAAAG